MSRLFTTGFEVQAPFAGGTSNCFCEDPGFSRIGNGGTTTYDTTIVRSGACSQKCVNATGSQDEKWQWQFTGVTTRTYYMRICTYVGGFGNGITWPLNLFGNTSLTGVEVIWNNSNGHLNLAAASSDTIVVGSSTYTPTTGNWIVLEASYVPSTGACHWWVNGTDMGGGTTETTSDTTLDFAWGCSSSSTTATWYFDDIAINDDQGASQNGRCGYQNKVVMLKPVSDSSTTGFTAGAGGTTNLFAAVDNAPPVGVALGSATNSSQIKDATSNTTDNYQPNLAAYTTAVASGGGGLSGSDTVVLCQGVCNHGNSTTTSRTNGLQVVSNPTISETTGATGTTAAGAAPTGWTALKTAVSYSPSPTLGTGPVMEFRKATASTDSSMADLMGLYVEYTPGSAGPDLNIARVN